MASAPRRGRLSFGPAFLARRLRQLLPQYPHLALCVAFSGGADSTALLAALSRLRARGLKLRAVHIDHQLQPASEAWSVQCRRLARRLGVALEVRRVHVARRRGESLEAAARSARYAALAAALRPGEVLLSAHHEDDQLETVLLQLLRGAGAAGLAAMPASTAFARTVLVRPLLQVPGHELRAWISAQRLPWIEDDSNQDEHLDRNYLRLRVLPVIRGRWPAAAATVTRSAQHLAEAQRLLEALGARDLDRAQVGAALSAKVLRALPPERRRNALRCWIVRAGLLAPSARTLEELAGALLAARADAHPAVAWSGGQVSREADLLRLHAKAQAPRAPRPATPVRWNWQRSATLELPAGGGRLTLRADAHGPVDLEALPAVLRVRSREGGERLRPVPGGVRRALKGLLQEARVPLQERASLPLVFAGKDLLAVADRWLDASVQAGAGARRRGYLSGR
jgi:tRNA(Ile)-lysidine synthase